MNEQTIVHILCVDDEASILRALSRLLQKSGFKVTTAETAEKGLALANEHTFDVAICDMRMPSRSGADFFVELYQQQPDVYRILVTGQADMASTVRAVNEGHIHNYVAKPWDSQQLLTLVRSGAEQGRLQRENSRLNKKIRQQNNKLKEANARLDEAVKKRTSQLRTALERLKSSAIRDQRHHQGALRTLYNALCVNPEIDGQFSRQISNLAELIAATMNCPTNLQRDISYAALISQIGLLGLSAELRAKSYYRMQNQERGQYMKHPMLAEQIMAPATHLSHVTEIISHQHEKYGGKEGPKKVQGDDIPLGARILAVARDFIAYKQGLNLHNSLDDHDAENMVVIHSGTWYDPKVVEALQQVLKLDFSVAQAISGETLVSVDDLSPGMVLTRNLYGANQLLLLPQEHEFTEETIGKLRLLQARLKQPLDLYINMDELDSPDSLNQHS